MPKHFFEASAIYFCPDDEVCSSQHGNLYFYLFELFEFQIS